jgi:four helix bundle protein
MDKDQSANVKMQSVSSNVKGNLEQRSYAFSLAILELTNALPNKRSAWIIADQLIRSATSIGANMVEGKAASSRVEFKKFFEISLKSANETKYWLGLLRDGHIAHRKDIDPLVQEVTEIASMLGRSVLTLKNK